MAKWQGGKEHVKPTDPTSHKMGPTLNLSILPNPEHNQNQTIKKVHSNVEEERRKRRLNSREEMSSTQRHHQTYWCHECDMSIHLLATAANSPAPFCPHCHRDHLELMDDPTPITATDTNNFFLDSPSFRRFFLPFFSDSNPSGDDTTIHSIIPTIKITSSFLDDDPVLFCAVCKDQFVIDVDAKLLPCNHLFHPDCILPWLNSNHDSCPLCRFQLPKPSKNDTSAATTTSESSSNLSSPSRVIEVREPRGFMDCTGSFSRIAMEMGFTHQDAADCAFPDVGVLSNFLPSHF